jgi:hypothetical protein
MDTAMYWDFVMQYAAHKIGEENKSTVHTKDTEK